MILKRMTASLKRQDWTMVLIEFVLVVVGVLLGFQINEWGNARASTQAHRESTLRLLDEAEGTIAYLKSAIAYEEGIADGLTLQLKAIADPQLRAAASRDDQLFNRARGIVPLAPPTSAFDDIVSAGNLTAIGTPAMREAISKFHATLSFEERMRQQLHPAVREVEDIDAVQVRVDPAGKFHWSLDYSAIAGNERDRRVLAHATQNHQLATTFRKRALRDATAMCVALAEVAGRTCNRDRPPPSFK